MGRIYETWNILLDTIGPRLEWPQYMPPLLLKGRPLNNEERFKVTLFAYINGVSYELLQEWCQLLHLVVDDKKWLHMKWLWNRFDKSSIHEYRYHMWNVAMKKDLWLNGHTFYYGRFSYNNPK